MICGVELLLEPRDSLLQLLNGLGFGPFEVGGGVIVAPGRFQSHGSLSRTVNYRLAGPPLT